MRTFRAVVAASAVGALSILGLGGTIPAASAAPAAAQTDAITDYGACIAGQGAGDLLLMIDESASLARTDPSKARVTAAKYLIDRLATYSDRNHVSVDVAVAGFSSDFTADRDWTPVTPQSADSLKSVVDGFGNRNTGNDTDYLTALEGAREYLAQRPAGTGNAPRCQAIAWFTDGEYDFFERGGLTVPYAPGVDMSTRAGVDQAVSQGTDQICRTGGVADQIRSSGIVIFGVGLVGSGPDQPNFDVMRRIVEGSAAGTGSCGNVNSPKPGDFHEASDIDQLLFAFDQLGTPGQTPIVRQTGVCANTVCDNARHNFTLDDSIDFVDILATSDPSLVPYLVAPSGEQLRIPLKDDPAVDSLALAGATVTYEWPADRDVRISLSKPAGPWQGQWALAYVDEGGGNVGSSQSSISLNAGVKPEWRNPQALAAGQSPAAGPAQSPELQFGLIDRNSNQMPATNLLGEVSLTIDLVPAGGQPDPTKFAPVTLPKEKIDQPVRLDLTNVDPGHYDLTLSLKLATKSTTDPTGAVVPGTDLVSVPVKLPIDIGPKVGYPTVATSLDFGEFAGSGTVSADLEVTGPGCVWVAKAEPKLTGNPDGVGAVTVAGSGAGSSKDDCLQLEEGKKGTLTVELTTENDAKGALTGTFVVSSVSKDAPDKEVQQNVKLTLELTKPLNQTTFWLTLVLALLLGPGVPLLLLYLAKWLTARIPAEPLLAVEIPVTVESGSVLREGQPFELRERDLVDPVPGLHSAARRLRVGSIELATHSGKSPFGSGYVVAQKSTLLSASSETPSSTGQPPRARLPLAIHNKWIVVSDPSWAPNQATVIVMVAGSTTQAQRDEIAQDLSRRVPGLLADLRAGAPGGFAGPGGGGPAPAAGDPFGSGGGDAFGPSGGDPFGGDPFGAGGPGGGDSFASSGSAPYGSGGGAGAYGPDSGNSFGAGGGNSSFAPPSPSGPSQSAPPMYTQPAAPQAPPMYTQPAPQQRPQPEAPPSDPFGAPPPPPRYGAPRNDGPPPPPQYGGGQEQQGNPW